MPFYQQSLLVLAATAFSAAAFSFNGGIAHSARSEFKPTALRVASVEESNDVGSSNEVQKMVPDMEAYAAGYSTVFEEVPFEVSEPTMGSIPSDLLGTYFRSGPAMFSAGSIVPPKKSLVQPKQQPVPDGSDQDRMVKHPFDGDGACLGVTFAGDGKATSRYRFVRTTALTKERKKGKKLYSGMETTRLGGAGVANGHGNDFPVPLYKHHLQPGLNKSRKNTSNTRSVYWSKKLITLWEGGLPYKLDALGLSTEGRSQLGGVLGEADPFSGKAVFDPVKDRMLFYSNKQDGGGSELTLYEFNSKFRVASANEYKLPGFAVLSDFAATEKYAIFVQPPISTNGMKFMISKEPSKSLKLDGGASMFQVLKRGSEGVMKTLSIPVDNMSDADLHFCNAYEEDDGKTLVVDAIRSDTSGVSATQTQWPWASSMKEFAASSSKKSLWRYTMKPSTGTVTKELITDVPTYFATINPTKNGQSYNYVYAAVGAMGSENAPPQGIAKINVDTKTIDTWFPKEYEFCGEPMFAQRKSDASNGEEDDGYIISILLNGKEKKSEIVILDAAKISEGPVARVPLGVAIPHGLHGCFASSDECQWSAEEVERRAKLADKMEARDHMWNEVKSDFSGLGLRLDDFEEYFGDIL